MNLDIRLTRPNIVVGATLMLLVLLCLYGVVHLWLLRQSYVEEIDNIRPRMARLVGITQSEKALQTAGSEAQAIVAKFAHLAERDRAGTSAAMQQDIRELMIGAGLALSGSQILKSRDGEGYERLRLDVTVEGTVDALDEALSALEVMRPMVLIESIEIKQVRRGSRAMAPGRAQPRGEIVGDPRRLSAKFELFSLRLKD